MLIEYLWDQILRSSFVIAVLFLEHPVIGLMVYASMGVAALVASVVCRKHWKSGRRVWAAMSGTFAVGAWMGLGICLRVLAGTLIWMAKE